MFEAFQLGPLLFRSHILFLFLGVWLGAEVFFRLASRDGLHIVRLQKEGLWLVLSFLLGGRLVGMLLLYRMYGQDPLRIFVLWDGVFSMSGALAGLVIALYVITWKARGQFLRWLDALLPAASIMLGFEWLGRFLGSLSYGKPTDLPWGVTVESMSVRYTVPIHPVQLYYALFFFALAILLLFMKKKRHIGIVTLLGVVGACVGVILLEFLRGDFAVTVFAKLSDFVFLALLFVSLGAIAVFERKISHRYSLINSVLLGIGTVAYLLLRPWITVISVEWRFSQFLAVLAMIATVVYVVVHRWKYPHFSARSKTF